MKDLIKKILNEYANPILVYEIVVGENLINEQDEFIRVLDSNDKDLVLFKNKHSQTSIGEFTFSRVNPKYIDDSIKEFQPQIIQLSKKVIENCEGKGCSIIVVDYINGFDYHMWLNKKPNGNIKLVINTSIHHPKHLLNKNQSPTMIIFEDGSIRYTNLQ